MFGRLRGEGTNQESGEAQQVEYLQYVFAEMLMEKG
jgi:hypothetical protein